MDAYMLNVQSGIDSITICLFSTWLPIKVVAVSFVVADHSIIDKSWISNAHCIASMFVVIAYCKTMKM